MPAHANAARLHQARAGRHPRCRQRHRQCACRAARAAPARARRRARPGAGDGAALVRTAPLVAQPVRAGRAAAVRAVRRHGAAALRGGDCGDDLVKPGTAMGPRPAADLRGNAPRARTRRAADVQQLRPGHAQRVARGVAGRGPPHPRAPLHRHARSRRHAGRRRLWRPGDGYGAPDADVRRCPSADARTEGDGRPQHDARPAFRSQRPRAARAGGTELRSLAPRRQASRDLRGDLRPRLEAATARGPDRPPGHRHQAALRVQGVARHSSLVTRHGIFVTGTDTGVGKTLVACSLLRAFAALGMTAAGMKPVATGVTPGATGDVERLVAAATVDAPNGAVNPYGFAPPVAPHIAARQAGVRIELERIERAFHALAARAQVVVVEGIGGFNVPLGPGTDTTQLAVRLALPVVMVVGMRLGCLNHALLTAEAIAARGLELAGWVANHVDPRMQAADENVQALRESLRAPLLARIPYSATIELPAIAACFD